MKILRRSTSLACLAMLPVMASGLFVAAPANAADSPASSANVNIAYTSLDGATKNEAAIIDSLIAATNLDRLTIDLTKLSSATLATQTARSYIAEVQSESAETNTLSREGSTLRSVSLKAKKSGGRAWQDAWGFHMTVNADLLDRISGIALTGSAGAGIIAGILAVNVEGFPLSTAGGIASGAIALALVGAAGVIQVCNIGGNGAQVNFTYGVVTCWPK